jgi:protein required for attachment to host cells
MTAHLKIQFVVADGSRARWVRRSEEAADDFTTTREMKAEHREAGHPQGVVFESFGSQRFSVEEADEAVRRHREVFARAVAEEINTEATRNAFERLAIVAPSHTLAAITEHLNAAAKTRLVHTLAKDLGKTPDHELGGWLRHLELG